MPPASLNVGKGYAANGPIGYKLAPIVSKAGGMIGPGPKACIGGAIIVGIIIWECTRLGDQLEAWLCAIQISYSFRACRALLDFFCLIWFEDWGRFLRLPAWAE